MASLAVVVQFVIRLMLYGLVWERWFDFFWVVVVPGLLPSLLAVALSARSFRRREPKVFALIGLGVAFLGFGSWFVLFGDLLHPR